MQCIWKMHRRRVFSAAGGKAFTSLVKAQLAAHPKLEHFADVDGISWMHRSLVACAPYFCRSFSTGIIEISKNGISQSKLKKILAVCEGKPWDADIEEALGGYSKELTKTLVYKTIENMESDSAKGFFNWAGKQEGYEHSKYLYNALFRNFLHAQKFESAIKVLQEMRESDVSINPKSFITLAQFYVKAGMMTEAEETIETMKSFGFSPSPKLYRVLLNGYLQASDEEGADRLLENFSGVEDFNAAILVYAQAGKAKSAQKVLDNMEKNGWLDNVRTYDLIVRCLCRANMIEEALKSLKNMQEKGLFPDVNIYNTLISYLVHEKRVDDALKLFSNMKDNGCQPDIKTHNIIITGYLGSGQNEKAHLHLEEMKVDGCMPTPETSKLFDATLGKVEEFEKEKVILEFSKSMKKVGTVSQQESKDVTCENKAKRILEICQGKSWNADTEEALSGYSKELTHKLVHKLLQSLEADLAKRFFTWSAKQEGYVHSRHEYNALFRNFFRAGKFDSAIEVLKEMKENDMAIDPKCFASLVHFYGKAGMMTEAEKAVEMMRSFGLKPDAKLYGVLLDGYLQANDDENAARLLQNLSGVENFNSAISAYARAGKADSALKGLEIMEKNGCPANVQTYHLLVRCFCKAEMIEEASKTLENMQERGLVPDVRVYNTLISYYCQKKSVDEALKLVSSMKDNGFKPDIITHNALINGYLKSGKTEKAHLQLEEMKMDGCMPTLETLKFFDASLVKEEEVEVEKAMPELLAKSKEKVATISQQELMDGKHGSKVERILEICEGKSWDVDTEKALSEYSKQLTHKLVQKLLQIMKADVAKGFFAWSEKQEGYVHSRHEYHALFRNLLRAGKFDSAIEVLKEMKENDMAIKPKCFASLVHYYGKAGMMTEAEEAVEMMRSFGLNPDAKLYGVFLNGYLQANDDESAARLLQNFSGVEDYNSAISAYARAGKADSALKVLEIMEENSCPANVQTYDLLVRCLCRAEMIEEASKALENMQEKGLVPDVRVYNTLVSYYCQKKRVVEALKLISNMKEIGCQPDMITHNSLITGYLKSRKFEKAHQHVEEMKAEGFMPTHETSRLFVVNLCMVEEVDKATQEFKAAAENDHKLSPDACNSLMKGLIKDGKLDEALKIFERMKEGACHADMSSYVVLLRGCCNLCRFDVMDQLLAEVKNKNLQLPVSTYVVLLQTYSRAKKFKEVVALFEELKESGQDLAGAKTSTALLDALSRAHQLDLGVKFCEYLANSGAKVNSRQLKYFFRLLVRMGRAGEATELMKAMSEKGCVIPEKSQL